MLFLIFSTEIERIGIVIIVEDKMISYNYIFYLDIYIFNNFSNDVHNFKSRSWIIFKILWCIHILIRYSQKYSYIWNVLFIFCNSYRSIGCKYLRVLAHAHKSIYTLEAGKNTFLILFVFLTILFSAKPTKPLCTVKIERHSLKDHILISQMPQSIWKIVTDRNNPLKFFFKKGYFFQKTFISLL